MNPHFGPGATEASKKKIHLQKEITCVLGIVHFLLVLYEGMGDHGQPSQLTFNVSFDTALWMSVFNSLEEQHIAENNPML